MTKNSIKMEFVGHVGIYDVLLLMAKGLKRIITINTETGDIKCPKELVDMEDLTDTDYKICKDIFQHIWLSDGSDDVFDYKNIQWKHCKKKPSDIEVEAFIARFGLEEEFKIPEATQQGEVLLPKDWEEEVSVLATFITHFNCAETGFLDDLPDEEPEEGNESEE